MIPAVIIGCEIGFWICVVSGLLARFVLRWRRAGVLLLAMTPVVDLILLAAVIIDLRAGGSATFVHGLAALYLGASLAYGHKIIAWADALFAHRFADGAAWVKKYGRTYATECWKDLVRTALAWGIAAIIIWTVTIVVDDLGRTQALWGIHRIFIIWLAADGIWAIHYTQWPRRQPAAAERVQADR